MTPEKEKKARGLSNCLEERYYIPFAVQFDEPSAVWGR